MTNTKLKELIDAVPACAELDKLQDYLEQILKHAQRYQWLRDCGNQLTEDDPCVSDSSFNAYFDKELDDVIDALIARTESLVKLGAATEND